MLTYTGIGPFGGLAFLKNAHALRTNAKANPSICVGWRKSGVVLTLG